MNLHGKWNTPSLSLLSAPADMDSQETMPFAKLPFLPPIPFSPVLSHPWTRLVPLWVLFVLTVPLYSVSVETQAPVYSRKPLVDLKKEGCGQLSESERAGVWRGCRRNTGDKRSGHGGGDGLERHQDGWLNRACWPRINREQRSRMTPGRQAGGGHPSSRSWSRLEGQPWWV